MRVVSISDAIKLEYAKAIGADLERLLCGRGYKEQHRQTLTAYFLDQVEKQPNCPQENFLKFVDENAGVDIFFVTGMREHAPVAAVTHLVPMTRVVEIRVQSNESVRQSRGAKTRNLGYR